MTKDFYNSINNSKYSKLADFYTDPDNNLLRFISELECCISGDTMCYYYPRYIPYFTIMREGTIMDFCTLTHEISHGIFSKYDHYSLNNDQSMLFTELEGYFFDFLTIEYLKDNYNKAEAVKVEKERLNTVYFTFENFIIMSYAIDILKKDRHIDPVLVEKRILEDDLDVSINESTLIECLSSSPKFNTTYLISFLTSIELEEIYLTDPEKAFYLLEKIRFNKRDDIITNLKNNNIKFVDKDYSVLQKKINI